MPGRDPGPVGERILIGFATVIAVILSPFLAVMAVLFGLLYGIGALVKIAIPRAYESLWSGNCGCGRTHMGGKKAV